VTFSLQTLDFFRVWRPSPQGWQHCVVRANAAFLWSFRTVPIRNETFEAGTETEPHMAVCVKSV
jgi:hypothetical protein